MPKSAVGWPICVRCLDDIRPTETTHPTGYRDEVMCAVCDLDANRAAARAATSLAVAMSLTAEHAEPGTPTEDRT